MVHITVRRARVDEKRALESLQRRASLGNPGDRENLLLNPDAIEVPVGDLAAGHVFVAESPGAVAGFHAVLPRADGDAELDALFVDPECWRRGYGRLLVEHAVDVARSRRAKALHVIGNPHAEAFYLACGFEPMGKHETRFGTALRMRRRL